MITRWQGNPDHKLLALFLEQASSNVEFLVGLEIKDARRIGRGFLKLGHVLHRIGAYGPMAWNQREENSQVRSPLDPRRTTN